MRQRRTNMDKVALAGCHAVGQVFHTPQDLLRRAADLKPYGSCRPPHVEDVCDFQHWEVVMGKSRVRTIIFVEQKTKPNTAVSHEGVFFVVTDF